MNSTIGLLGFKGQKVVQITKKTLILNSWTLKVAEKDLCEGHGGSNYLVIYSVFINDKFSEKQTTAFKCAGDDSTN